MSDVMLGCMHAYLLVFIINTFSGNLLSGNSSQLVHSVCLVPKTCKSVDWL